MEVVIYFDLKSRSLSAVILYYLNFVVVGGGYDGGVGIWCMCKNILTQNVMELFVESLFYYKVLYRCIVQFFSAGIILML